jgi:8-oxo-dGTP pyrophosphatase MutT (NUDIX family)
MGTPQDDHRPRLLELLARAQLFDARDRETRDEIAAFVGANPDCLLRSNLAGHLTGSAFVVDRERRRLLLIHHRALGRWLQPGGHADGDPDLAAGARREAVEETGIEDLDLISPDPFDLDVHRIPAKPGVPEHLHYDVRFLFVAAGDTAPQAAEREVHAAAWVRLAALEEMGIEESVLRPARRIEAAPPTAGPPPRSWRNR